MVATDYVRWFSDIRLGDVALVGGKNASLGELYSTLSKQGVRVPNGFALTAEAYRDALTAPKAWERLHQLLDNFDKRNVDVLAKRATEAREIVYKATATGPLLEQIDRAYRQLETEYRTSVAVAVRSSATAEDLPSASFAGQHESFLNVSGIDELFEACRRCFASIFTDRAISYRVDNGFDQDLGLVRMGMRDYDPVAAAWTTPDPLYLEAVQKSLERPLAGANLYGYAHGNPVTGRDPTGLDSVFVVVGTDDPSGVHTQAAADNFVRRVDRVLHVNTVEGISARLQSNDRVYVVVPPSMSASNVALLRSYGGGIPNYQVVQTNAAGDRKIAHPRTHGCSKPNASWDCQCTISTRLREPECSTITSTNNPKGIS